MKTWVLKLVLGTKYLSFVDEYFLKVFALCNVYVQCGIDYCNMICFSAYLQTFRIRICQLFGFLVLTHICQSWNCFHNTITCFWVPLTQTVLLWRSEFCVTVIEVLNRFDAGLLCWVYLLAHWVVHLGRLLVWFTWMVYLDCPPISLTCVACLVGVYKRWLYWYSCFLVWSSYNILMAVGSGCNSCDFCSYYMPHN